MANGLGQGMHLQGATLTASALSISNSSNDGIVATGASDLTIDSGSFSNNYRGVSITGTETATAAFNITNSSFTQNAESGLYVEYASGNADNNLSNNNQFYGMECDNTTFSTCDTNDLTSNLLGEQTGCDATCGTEANPAVTE